MTGFSVNEDALDNISANLRRQAEYCEAAFQHLNQHFRRDHSGGLYVFSVNQASESVYQFIGDWFKTASSECFDAAADRIDKTVAYYRATDSETAADFDLAIDLLGSGTELPITSDHDSEAFADDVSAIQAFNRPPDDYSNDQNYTYTPDILGSISFAGGLRATVYGVTSAASWIGLMASAYDTHEALVEPVSGDWAEVRANADVLDHFANFSTYIANSIELVRAQLSEMWTGNAASLFDEYLSKLCSGFRVAEIEFNELSEMYKKVTEDIVRARNDVTFIGDLIADKAVAASAAVIAAKTTIATPAAAVTIPAAVALLAKVIKGIIDANNYVESTQQTIESRSRRIVNYALPNLPKPDDNSSAMTHLPE